MDDPPRPARASLAHIAASVGLAIGLANLVAEVVIYGALLVPRYPDPHRMPWYGFAAMYVPVLLAAIAVGARLRGAAAIGTAALAAGAAVTLEKAALAWAEAPGHQASLAATNPARFLALQAPRMALGFLALFALIAAVARRVGSPPGSRA